MPCFVEGSQDRPRYVLLLGFPMGSDSLLDVTIVNLLQHSAWPDAAHVAGVAMGKAKMRKRD